MLVRRDNLLKRIAGASRFAERSGKFAGSLFRKRPTTQCGARQAGRGLTSAGLAALYDRCGIGPEVAQTPA